MQEESAKTVGEEKSRDLKRDDDTHQNYASLNGLLSDYCKA